MFSMYVYQVYFVVCMLLGDYMGNHKIVVFYYNYIWKGLLIVPYIIIRRSYMYNLFI